MLAHTGVWSVYSKRRLSMAWSRNRDADSRQRLRPWDPDKGSRSPSSQPAESNVDEAVTRAAATRLSADQSLARQGSHSARCRLSAGKKMERAIKNMRVLKVLYIF